MRIGTNRTSRLLAFAGVLAILGGCGGGDSTDSITITGTAAIGKALSGASVVVTCAAGTGSATSNADGSYTVTINSGKGPCLLTATQGTTVLHSVASGAGVVNITPLTDMLATYLATQAGTSVNNLLSNANGRGILQSSSAINAAQNAVASIMQTDFGVTLSSNNFLTATIVPGSSRSATDTDLENLLRAGAVNTNGAVSSVVNVIVRAVAEQAIPFVAPSGAT